MSIDPRVPVIVGVGQCTEHPDDRSTYDTRPTPLDLMTVALEHAANDTGVGRALLETLDELVAVRSFTWHTADPAKLVVERLGLGDVRTRLTPTSGTVPQKLVHESARRIAAGELDAIAIVGSEAMYARALAQREGRRTDWVVQKEGATPPDEERIPFTEQELAQGLTLPIDVYPLLENARRERRGWTIDEHRHQLGRLWANFARVAATNPYAWRHDKLDAATITTPSPVNRMISFPYTKLMVANMPVDMGAAFVMTSYETAQSLKISHDRLIFPQCGAEADDHWFVSDRPQLDDSPAMRAIWRSLTDFGANVDDLTHLDLYSCFPTVVQTASDVLGIDPFSHERPPTVTGGLTFGGGPGNNYVTHSIASMVERLRERPDGNGLVTSLGWFSTKHAWGTYATTPPNNGFKWRSVQTEVDAQRTMTCTTEDGPITIESYTVPHERDGTPKQLIVVGRRDDGRRVWASNTDVALASDAEVNELIGHRANVRSGLVSLD